MASPQRSSFFGSLPRRPKAAAQSRPESFHLFPELPLELRLKIWTHVAHLPRIIPISFGDRPDVAWAPVTMGNTMREIYDGAPNPKWLAKNSYPAILLACHESRDETLKEYKLCFGKQLRGGSMYFSPASDILLFMHATEVSEFFWKYWLEPQEVSDRMFVHFVAVVVGDLGWKQDEFQGWLDKRQATHAADIYPNLQHMFLVNLGRDSQNEIDFGKLISDSSELSRVFEKLNDEREVGKPGVLRVNL